mgnify:CR=1 FL=1
MNDATQVEGLDSRAPTHVVGLGASAGGIEALSEFLAALSPELDAAFVVVMHLSPDVESTLDRVLARNTSMSVTVIEARQTLARGHLYVAPPRGSLAIENGTLVLDAEPALATAVGARHPIDQLFSALAAARRERAIAVVLSGSGSDGAQGVQAIKAHGGLVLAQDPDGAQFGSMPRATAANVRADVVDTPTGLAAAIARIVSGEHAAAEADAQAAVDTIDNVLELVRAKNGYDFRSYRRSTIQRRIQRRVALGGDGDVERYLERLRREAPERELLCRDLLINVTEFFRDPAAFEALDAKVIRPMVESARPDASLRVWVPGCATGEEAYTIAMLLARALESAARPMDFQLFASDIDPQAIEAASQGYYPVGIEPRVPEGLLERYFVRSGGHFRVRRAIRERMVFAVHDLTQDPPFTRMDLVSCRNLLIYFRSEIQTHVLQLMAYALGDEGFLLLGSSESVSAVRDVFDTVDSESRIYRRNDRRAPAPRLQSLDSILREPAPAAETPRRLGPSARATAPSSHAVVLEQLITREGAFALALDDEMRLQHVYGDPGGALRVPSGGITTEIGALTRGEFKTCITTNVQRARRLDTEVVSRSVRIDGADGERTMDVRVVPLGEPAGSLDTLILVRPVASEEKGAADPDGSEPLVAEAREGSSERREDLEAELHRTRGRLSRTIEELEVSNEELQTANEELMTANEELQSTNEELQSTNEELHTVNTEHQERILELTEVTHDLQNVLASSEIGTILLDRDLRIRKFTDVATQVVHLMEQDRGRPLHHITNALSDVDLGAVVRAAMGSGAGREDTVHTVDGRTYLMRCHPLRDDLDEVEGAMVTFTDVTTLERVTDELRVSEQRFRHVMRHLQQAVFLRRRVDQRLEFVSEHATELFGGIEAVLGVDELLAFVHPEDAGTVRDAFEASTELQVEMDFRLREDEDGRERWLHCSIRPASQDAHQGYDVGYLFEITRRKSSELVLRREVERFEGFINAMPDRFFWRGHDGQWQRLRASLPATTTVTDPRPELSSIVSRASMRAIEGAAEAARETGELQTISFDAHDSRTSRSFEARLLMVGDQGVLCVLRDVSELRRSERELVTLTRSLEREANSDHLTRLPNRRGLEKVLFAELERCRRLGTRLCAILVDCDNFKRVNDTMGHATGDIALQEIGKRLRGVLRPSDTIGRVGGDEFLVLLPDTRHAEAMQLAERLRLAITGSPLTSGRDVIGITGSLGVATIPQDVVSIEELISLTQHALAHSKRVGKNRVTSHEYGEDAEALDPRDELMAVLETGRGFRTFAQPILDLHSGLISGYELLTRGPGGALESPADIFQLSSENNILTSVDLHCVKRNVGWARDHLDRGRFHVNLFPSTILDTPAARLLAVFGDPDLLRHFCVEISEQQFIGDPNYLKPHVEELRREGARIALDDVGFGRSSLESLLLLEPETVKLDKSVVQGAAEDGAQRRTLERLIGVIRGIDADIVAEGVETDADREVLVDLGVEFAQGYLFGRSTDRLISAN